jgi:hypothetical protein
VPEYRLFRSFEKEEKEEEEEEEKEWAMTQPQVWTLLSEYREPLLPDRS